MLANTDKQKNCSNKKDELFGLNLWKVGETFSLGRESTENVANRLTRLMRFVKRDIFVNIFSLPQSCSTNSWEQIKRLQRQVY